MDRFLISFRAIENGAFTHRLSPHARFFRLADNGQSVRACDALRASQFVQAIGVGLDHTPNDHDRSINLFIHGFNISQEDMFTRFDLFADGLKAQGFEGVTIAIDWPSNGRLLHYGYDRWDANKMADRLVRSVFRRLAMFASRTQDVELNLIAHSMGTYVSRQAFHVAADMQGRAGEWQLNNVVFISADVSSRSMCDQHPKSSALLSKTGTFTNYYSVHDISLIAAKAVRLWNRPRLGRVGSPLERDARVRDVSCSEYFEARRADLAEATGLGRVALSHTWQFYDEGFFGDLVATLRARDIATNISTRRFLENGDAALIPY